MTSHPTRKVSPFRATPTLSSPIRRLADLPGLSCSMSFLKNRSNETSVKTTLKFPSNRMPLLTNDRPTKDSTVPWALLETETPPPLALHRAVNDIDCMVTNPSANINGTLRFFKIPNPLLTDMTIISMAPTDMTITSMAPAVTNSSRSTTTSTTSRTTDRPGLTISSHSSPRSIPRAVTRVCHSSLTAPRHLTMRHLTAPRLFTMRHLIAAPQLHTMRHLPATSLLLYLIVMFPLRVPLRRSASRGSSPAPRGSRKTRSLLVQPRLTPECRRRRRPILTPDVLHARLQVAHPAFRRRFVAATPSRTWPVTGVVVASFARTTENANRASEVTR